MFKRSLCSFLIVAIVFAATPAFPCSAVLVGKKASATGEVLVGHNEDNGGRIIMAQYFVPHMQHPAGATIVVEPGKAPVPQVPETLAYWWTETLSPGGSSFSDSFLNEKGVLIVTNSCADSKVVDGEVKEGGIGYALRRVMAERASSAREAVTIGAQLLDEYGYFHSGRSYQVADANEAWVFHVMNGKHYLAVRVPDNQIYVMSNAYVLGKVNLNDKANVIASPGLVEYAIAKGWYKPAKAGDYADFDFARVFQSAAMRDNDSKKYRHRSNLFMMTGKDYPDVQNFPTFVTVDHPVTIDDIKKTLSYHSEGRPYFKDTPEVYHYSSNTVCMNSTMESMVFQMREQPELILAWRSSGRGCTNGYAPTYPLAGVPAGYSVAPDPVTAQNRHFNAPREWFSYNPELPWWTFRTLDTLLNYQYAESKGMKDALNGLYSKWAAEIPHVDAKARALLAVNKDEARLFLYNYSNDQHKLLAATAGDYIRKLTPYTMAIQAEELSLTDSGSVDVVLYTTPDFDATAIDRDQTFFNVGYVYNTFAKPVAFTAKDMNGDGRPDMVITFKTTEAIRNGVADVVTEMYLRTMHNNKVIVAMDTVTIRK